MENMSEEKLQEQAEQEEIEQDVGIESDMEVGQEELYQVTHDVFQLNEETLSIDGIKYAIRENYRSALDTSQLEHRLSDFFAKFDFIVGDLGYEKLRLRGFYYDDTKGIPLDMRISTLEDYLTEYCNFGCPYFVLERLDEKTVFPNYDRRDRLRNQKSNKKKKRRRRDRRKTNKRMKTHKKFEKKRTEDQGHSRPKSKNDSIKVREVRDDSGKKRFQIKKKSREES